VDQGQLGQKVHKTPSQQKKTKDKHPPVIPMMVRSIKIGGLGSKPTWVKNKTPAPNLPAHKGLEMWPKQ
jgi:hypothetical protein